MDAEAARALIHSPASLERLGRDPQALRRGVRQGELRRLHRGRYVRADDWSAMRPEDQHLLEVLAVEPARRGGDVVASHESAAVLHGLPLYRRRPRGVHVSGPRTRGVVSAPGLVLRHEVEVARVDRTQVGGIPCTTLQRTVYDLIRTTPRETAVAAADAALRLVAWSEAERSYSLIVAEQWRQELLARIARSSGRRGIRQARWVAAFADGRAHLPGESVSRLYLDDLGFAAPRLQVPFEGPGGRRYEIDFGLDDVDAWGEFDGEGKYSDPAMLRGRTSREVFIREKEREDWIRGHSGRSFVRWGSPHITSAEALRRRLADFHIAPRR
ncbi:MULTISPECIES: type IV toxin-antitoxin system AbiEi family antitoxin domain-containing protein [Microbacterium]|uniref:type IV toxin-antitoxin system AbiEi family antitoxin domain-containing protein n=1 Tax=Microbacterium TaxID=33882 RepID=UPI000D64FBED|nr:MULTISPECIES: type IV toxin-antitoxin system AbiEi family antitoxin domain-containing protein [Microbacterium]